ncbi:MAG: ATP-binding cassette domain-containing protein [Cryomorphaceae bacterium]|nr:ATP-binding cassette domain-containing protein [Cryomorphaceae bacterium]
MENILQTDALSKKYGNIWALQKVSLNVPTGSVLGVLGPNGSGKTTFLGILLGIIHPTEGNFSWFNGGEKFLPGEVGGILEAPIFLPKLTAMQNLKMSAVIKNADEAECRRVLQQVGLDHVADVNAGNFSLGMKQRLALGSALLGNPKVLVLDEPLNGIDPEGIFELRNLIKRLALEGVTVIISSHILDEIEKVCTHLAIFKKGQLVDFSVLNDTEKSGDAVRYQVAANVSIADLHKTMKDWPFLIHAEIQEDFLHVEVQLPGDAVALNTFLFNKGIVLKHLVPLRDGVEKLFIEKTR